MTPLLLLGLVGVGYMMYPMVLTWLAPGSKSGSASSTDPSTDAPGAGGPPKGSVFRPRKMHMHAIHSGVQDYDKEKAVEIDSFTNTLGGQTKIIRTHRGDLLQEYV